MSSSSRQGVGEPDHPTTSRADGVRPHGGAERGITVRRHATLVAMCLVIFLFFLWGLAMNLVNSLNEPFKSYLDLSGTQANFLQVAYYGAYAVMAIPAAWVSRRFGYKTGIIAGLTIFALGALVTVPAVDSMSYAIFLLAMFVIAAGATTLETNANPYITKLGGAKREALRLNIAQSFNGVGSVVGPLIVSAVLPAAVIAGADPGQMAGLRESVMDNIGRVYVVLAVVLACVLLFFLIAKLPEPGNTDEDDPAAEAPLSTDGRLRALLVFPHFRLGIVAAFTFIGGQVAAMALVASFAIDQIEGLSSQAGARYLALATALFAIGRIVTTPLLAKIPSGRLLGWYMVLSAIGMLIGVLGIGAASVWAVILAFFFISIGFPTIFALAIRGFQGDAAKSGSSLVVMSIVGAAIVPLITGILSDALGIGWAFALIALIFCFDAWYGFVGAHTGPIKENAHA